MEMEQSVEGFRLSPQQGRLWRWLAAPEDGSPFVAPFSAQCRVEIAGELDRPALGRAVDRAVERNELLRTAFRLLPGLAAPLQMISEPVPTLTQIPLGGGDLSGRGPAEQEAALAAQLAADREAPFDFAAVPLLRASLWTLGPRTYVLLLTLPALLSDAAGLDNLVREIALCYAVELGAPAPEEPLQYADLSEWQHELLESEETGEGRKLWQRQVEALPALQAGGAPVLPWDEAPGPASSFSPRTAAVALPADLSGRIEALARAAGVQVQEVLLAGWLTVLVRSAGERRLAIAVSYEGRRFDELKEALGPFARFLPVPVQMEEGERFRDLLARLHETLRESYEWQEYFSWDLAVEPGREIPEFLPLAFEHRGRPRGHRSGGALFTAAQTAVCIERFEAVLLSRERACDGGLEAEVRYDAGRVPERAAVLLAERLSTLLASVVATPDQAVGDLALLGPEESRILAAANDTRIDFGRPQLLHKLVEEQAARSPEQTAVVSGDLRLTYAELTGRASLLAQRLRALGVGTETRVAVCLERSPEMVIALLAVLEAGGAYVPLDPSYPAARLAFMLEDARPPVLVVVGEPPAGLPLAGVQVVDVAEEESKETLAAGAPAAPASPDQLAYVIYTSGSTGRPKGVLVSHRAICNRLLWMQHAYPLGAGDRVLQKTPYSFDASIWEIFSPLLAGAQLVLAEPQGHQDMAYLAGAVARHGVTRLQLVPSLLRPFLDEPGAGEIAAGRRFDSLFCGGEELPAGLAERARSLLSCSVTNLYGPTEAAIDATSHATVPGEKRVPIGRPLANVQVHLVSPRLPPISQAPSGAPGELLIGGTNLARGYLGRPDLTAERFVPNPFTEIPGQRLYRTGDLARRRPKGDIEYLGRIDRQVKLRGARIELGEIEALLAGHPGVRQAVVVARSASAADADARLVAYVVPRPGGETPRAGELRELLAAALPAHMVPAAFVLLRALPRTPSGKLDLAALPEPEPETVEGEGPALRTPTEQLLAGIWAEVLGCGRVTAEDSFFELGGHSLNATQVVSRVRKAFGVELRIQALFEAPVLADYATAIDRAVRAGHGLVAPPIEPISQGLRGGRLPLSFAQQRLWFLEQRLPGTPLYNIPDAFRFAGALNVAALEAALGETIRRHESLRTTFPTYRGEAIQWIVPADARVARRLPLVDLTALPADVREAEAVRQMAAEGERPFDLARGPLLRALLLRLASDDHWLPLTLHHIVSDAWSAGVLVREVVALYRAFVAGGASPLPEPRLQYADFAGWQRGWLAGEVLARHLDYWRRQLTGAPAVLDLPADRPRPLRPYYRGATRAVRMPAELAAGLNALARRENATLFMVLLAAFQVLLRHHARCDDIVVGTDIANRNQAETEGMIGFFINQLVLRTRLDGDPTFTELLARVREVTLGAYAHQDMPFDLLVDDLLPERPHHAPLFQAKLFVDNTPAEKIEQPGLTLTRLPVDMRTAKLDLTLALQETPDGLNGWVNYSTDLFEARTVTRLMSQLTRLAEAVVARPESRLHELDAVLAEQARQERAAEKKDLLAIGFKRGFKGGFKRHQEI